MNDIFPNTKDKRKVIYFNNKNLKENNHYINFIKEISSEFLNLNGFKHNKDDWYIDVIRYNLNDDKKRIKSGLAWHCENDNIDNVITVLFYLRIDKDIKDGNLRYKDKNNEKKILEIKSGTTVIMDGRVYHKPQDPYGTGIRDLIIVSFTKD